MSNDNIPDHSGNSIKVKDFIKYITEAPEAKIIIRVEVNKYKKYKQSIALTIITSIFFIKKNYESSPRIRH